MALWFVPLGVADTRGDGARLGFPPCRRFAARRTDFAFIGGVNGDGRLTGQCPIQQFSRDRASQLNGEFFEIEEQGAAGWTIGAVEFVGQIFGNPFEVRLLSGDFRPHDEFASHP